MILHEPTRHDLRILQWVLIDVSRWGVKCGKSPPMGFCVGVVGELGDGMGME